MKSCRLTKLQVSQQIPVGAFCVLLLQLILHHRPAGQLSLLMSYYSLSEMSLCVPATLCWPCRCCCCMDTRTSFGSTTLIFKNAQGQ